MDTPSAKSVLLIDDDEELCDLLRKFLGHEGFEIEVTMDGTSGLERAVSGEHSVVVLDVMLPEMNGFDVLREIRRCSYVPVIMLTARGEDVDRIVGLELGADDYQAKPFNPRELAARIRAIVRRTLPLTDFQSDRVTIVSSSDPGLAMYAEQGWDLPFLQMQAYLTNHPDASVSFMRAGVRTDLARGTFDDSVPSWEQKLFAFRALDQHDSPRCQPNFLPAN